MRSRLKFQRQFRAWLGDHPQEAVDFISRQTGYSRDYIRWAAGLIGKKPWPGSETFRKKMVALGCTNRRWQCRTPEQIARAFRTRVVLYEPGDGEDGLPPAPGVV